MPHTDAFYQWNDRVQALFPALRPHHRTALAESRFGIALAGVCGLTTVAADLARFLAVPAHALTQRLREFDRPAHAQRGPARTALGVRSASDRCSAGPRPGTRTRASSSPSIRRS